MAAFCIAGPLALRPAGAANPAYACPDPAAKLALSKGKPVCVRGKTVTDAIAAPATPDPVADARGAYTVAALKTAGDAAQHKLQSADVLFYAVLAIVGIALVCALILFVGVARFTLNRAKLADTMARAPDVHVENAAIIDQMVSPESARMIVQTSQTGFALVVAALLFFFSYLTFIYGASFSAPPSQAVAGNAPAGHVPAKR